MDQKTYHNSHRNIRDWTNKYLSCLSRSVSSSINWCESVVKNNPVAGKQCSWWWWSTAWGEVFQDWLQLYTMGIMPLSWEITSPTNWIPWGWREGDIVILYLYSVLSTFYLCSLHVTYLTPSREDLLRSVKAWNHEVSVGLYEMFWCACERSNNIELHMWKFQETWSFIFTHSLLQTTDFVYFSIKWKDWNFSFPESPLQSLLAETCVRWGRSGRVIPHILRTQSNTVRYKEEKQSKIFQVLRLWLGSVTRVWKGV